MPVYEFLLQLAAAVMLLLYSTRMVRTGVERALGASLRNLFVRSKSGIALNVVVGTMGAAMLQSSTAIALLVSGFAATGVMGVTGSLAVMLGADLGTALVVQFLSLDLAIFIPILIATGGILFLKFESRTVKQIGRISLGIAFILISLKMIGEATLPMRESQFLPEIVRYISDDPITALLGAVLLTFIFHSSVAAILLFATFAGIGILPLETGIILIIGANVGGALVAVWLTRSSHVKARRITVGNLLIRTCGAMIALVALHTFTLPISVLGTDASRQLVNFHLGFNIVLVFLFLPLVIPIANLMKNFINDKNDPSDETNPSSALNKDVLSRPNLALACVTRELLKMSDQIDMMFKPIMDMFVVSNPNEMERLQSMDTSVNQAHTEIKLYIAELNKKHLQAEDAQRALQLSNFAISLERVGDLISKDLMKLASELHKQRLNFSQEGWSELTNLHDRVSTNIQLALNVLVSDDLDSARQLAKEKEIMRSLEQKSHDNHLTRLGKGTADSIATSSIHLETVRALKEINSRYIAFAYPILEKYGELLDSRIAVSKW